MDLKVELFTVKQMDIDLKHDVLVLIQTANFVLCRSLNRTCSQNLDLKVELRTHKRDVFVSTQTQKINHVFNQDLQCQNLDLEGDLFTVKQEAERTRQAAMDKTRVSGTL